MSAFPAVPPAEAVALGWTLLHFVWQSSAIVLLYAAVDRCSTRASASVRYGVALAALALMPVAFVATFVQQERLVSHTLAGPQVIVAAPSGVMPIALLEPLPAAAPLADGAALWLAGHGAPLLPWLDAVWLCGVLLLALRAAGGWWTLEAIGRRARAAVPEPLARSFGRLAEEYHVSRRVVLRVSDEVLSPMVFGLWRTVVLVPLSAIASLAPEQLEAVLAHELAHVRRWDTLFNLLQTSVECLFFFQPAVWWLSRKAGEFREVCCDEVAAQACSNPVVYAEALLQLEQQRARHLQLALALDGGGNNLLTRVRRILGENTMEQQSVSAFRMVAAATVLGGLLLAPHVAHGIHQTPTPEQLPAASQQPAEPAIVAAPAAPVHVQTAATPRTEPAAAPVQPAQASAAPAPQARRQLARPDTDGGHFVTGMRDAGYALDLNSDLNQIVTLRSVGVTPEYARAMAETGLGKPTLHELITLRSLGVTPEYIGSLKGTPLAPSSFGDVVTTKSLGLTPEYARSLDALGLGRPTMHEVVSLRSMGVTPEYVAGLKSSGIAPVDLREVVTMKAVGITPEYAKDMAAAGFPGLNSRELVSLRAQGMTPEYARWLKSTFPNADLRAMRQAAVLHIDPDFLAKAKDGGFSGADLQKLTRLKMSGLLD